MGNRFIDMVGATCGSLMVLRLAGPIIKGGQARWVCRCECGKEHEAAGRELRDGKISSCGCKKASLCAAANITHGMAGKSNTAPEYRIWCEMIQRCTNPKSNRYYSHGSRGIKVCERWRCFENFIADMGRRPDKRMSIDRIDNDGNYEPSNCRWATRLEQARNKRTSVKLTINGVTKHLYDWLEGSSLRYATVTARLRSGILPEDAIKEGRAPRRALRR